MRKLAVLTFLTLDGVMQSPSSPDEDPSDGFTLGGWARNCWDEVMQQVMQEAMADPYDLLLGRTTYEMFSGAFAGADNENAVSNKLNHAKKYVVTSSLQELSWQNSQRIAGNIVAEVSQLKAQYGPLLQVHGSWQLIQLLLSHHLIDEFRLWAFPVVAGTGKRLFADGAIPTALELTKYAPLPCGAVMNFYRRVEGPNFRSRNL